MRINVLHHAPNKGFGSIKTWADTHDDEFHQTAAEIIKNGIPKGNKDVRFKLLDFITKR